MQPGSLLLAAVFVTALPGPGVIADRYERAALRGDDRAADALLAPDARRARGSGAYFRSSVRANHMTFAARTVHGRRFDYRFVAHCAAGAKGLVPLGGTLHLTLVRRVPGWRIGAVGWDQRFGDAAHCPR